MAAKKFNRKRADRVIDFCQKLTVPSGEGAGKPFRFDDFQNKFIRAVYSPMDECSRRRIVRRAILSIARKNGKTALIACLVLAHLVGPEAVRNGEIYSAANEREQAAIVFKYVKQIVEADEELSALITIVETTKTMVCYQNGSFYRAISAEAGSKHGFNPTLVIYDELAQSKKRDLYDALDTSMGGREEPLFIVISTQSDDPQHILSQLIDDGLSGHDATTVCHLYAVADDYPREKIFANERIWKKANPALGTFRSLDEIRTAAARAKRMPSFENTFRNLYLNQRIDSQSPLITRAEWMACCDKTADIPEGSRIYLALDLSGKLDLTALTAVTEDGGDTLKPWFWKPADLVSDHEARDRVPYSAWIREGWLNTTPGVVVNYDYIAMFLAELNAKYVILGMAYDRWRIGDLMNAMDRIGLGAYQGEYQEWNDGIRMVPWGQGFADMAPAVDALELSVMEHKLKHNGNPVLTWNIANAKAVSDAAGNRKFDKSKTRFRIDGAVTSAMCVGLKSRDMKESGSVYEERGVICF